MIAQETIRQIQQAADIVEVVSDFVSLKKRGANYIACCPFHDEKTPSFSVSPAKGIYKCFGCGKAGDPITFVREVEHITYVEALRYLAQKYHIEIIEDKSTEAVRQENSERESLLIALNHANHFYQNLLHQHPDGQAIGISYFRERGFSDITVKKFELGYSLTDWEAFLKDASKNQFQTDVLEKAGLILKNEKTGSFYDRFRGRVIFPIHNISGKTIAFGARILVNDKNQPKYINSPETEVYHKSDILYGIFQAKNKIRDADECLLVEGYTDVIAMHQGGVENVVASSGTSLTENQIKLVSRFTENVTVLYDGDSAGIKASLRGIDMILEAGLNVRIVLFPDGHDPDSFIRKEGSQAFREYLENHKQDFITFKTELYLEEAGKDPIKKAELIKDISESIAKVPDSIKRSVFFQQCSRLLGIDEAVLITEYNKLQFKKRQDKNEKNNPDLPVLESLENTLPAEQPSSFTEEDSLALQEKELMRLIIIHANVKIGDSTPFNQYMLQEVSDVELKTPRYKRLFDIYHKALENNIIPDTNYFKSLGDEAIFQEVMELTSERLESSENWEKYKIPKPEKDNNLAESALSNIYRLKLKNVQLFHKQKREELKKEKDVDKITELLTLCIALKEQEKILAKELTIVINK
ncbi:MAG: DNA primase [Cytophagales bacterium]|nr:DNA primase [Cytophagales bacterium]